MTNKEREDFYSGKDEVELTDELIEQIVKEKPKTKRKPKTTK